MMAILKSIGQLTFFYLWYLLVYLLLCRVTSLFYTMVKWCNGEMLPDGSGMMVRLLRPDD